MGITLRWRNFNYMLEIDILRDNLRKNCGVLRDDLGEGVSKWCQDALPAKFMSLFFVLSQRSEGDALGGPYLAVHMRRRDYLYGHKKEVPSIKGTAQQLKEMLIKLKLKTLFVATDAPVEGKPCLCPLIDVTSANSRRGGGWVKRH